MSPINILCHLGVCICPPSLPCFVPGRWPPVLSSISWAHFSADFNAGLSLERIRGCVDGWGEGRAGPPRLTSMQLLLLQWNCFCELQLWSCRHFCSSCSHWICKDQPSVPHFSWGGIASLAEPRDSPRVLCLLAQPPLFLCHIVNGKVSVGAYKAWLQSLWSLRLRPLPICTVQFYVTWHSESHLRGCEPQLREHIHEIGL